MDDSFKICDDQSSVREDAEADDRLNVVPWENSTISIKSFA